MNRLIQIALICLSLIGAAFCQDREVTAGDLNGVPRSHKYAWAVIGGTALGIGIGAIAPGGNKSAVKGALIGGSLTSAIYLHKSSRAAYGKRQWAHVITNTVLGTGIAWTLCNCSTGAWAGALIGGGGTAIFQSFGSDRSRIASFTGTNAETSARVQKSEDLETEGLLVEGSDIKASQSKLSSNGARLPRKDKAAVSDERNKLE